MHQKKTLCKTHETVSRLEIVLAKATGSTGIKTRQPGRPEEIHQNQETVAPGDLTSMKVRMKGVELRNYNNEKYLLFLFVASRTLL